MEAHGSELHVVAAVLYCNSRTTVLGLTISGWCRYTVCYAAEPLNPGAQSGKGTWYTTGSGDVAKGAAFVFRCFFGGPCCAGPAAAVPLSPTAAAAHATQQPEEGKD